MEYVINCENVEIDNSEIGVSVFLSAKAKFMVSRRERNLNKIARSKGNYLSIYRNFGAKDDEGYDTVPYVYLECNIEDLSAEWGDFQIEVGREKMLLDDETDTLLIYYQLDDETFESFKEILKIIDQDGECIKFA